MKVKCKLLCVRFFRSILVFLKLYVETVTIRFDTLPHCETQDCSHLLFSAYLSVPHSFTVLNPNCDAINPSQLEIMFMYHFALI
jgi:hypothetical protein